MDEFSATDAAREVARANDFAQGLTNRTAGMTSLVWALASALIFLTYGTAGGWLDRLGAEWAYAVLWIPGVILGSALTGALWRSHAVSLSKTAPAGEGWRHLGVNLLLFFALAAPLAYLVLATNIDWGISAIMVIVNGLFAFIVAWRESRESLLCSRHTMFGGAFMLAAGIALAIAGWSETAQSLAGAGIAAIGWGATGYWTVLRS